MAFPNVAGKPSGENWSRVADAYDKVLDEEDALNPVGAGANEVISVVNATLPFSKASYIVDMGTGSGPLISKILNSKQCAEQIPEGARVVAADVAHALLEILEERKKEREQKSDLWRRLEVKEWDARNLKDMVEDEEVSHLLSTFSYWSFAGEKPALAEAVRILKTGGLFVETSMGYTEWGHLASFFGQARPDKPVPGPSPGWMSVDGVKKILTEMGLNDVHAREFDMALPFETHEAAVEFPFAAFPWAKGFTADFSEEEVATTKRKMLEFIVEKHPEAPFRLDGTGLIGWGTK